MLFNVFLDMDQSQNGLTLAFAADICVRATEYEVNRLLFSRITLKAATYTAHGDPRSDASGNTRR